MSIVVVGSVAYDTVEAGNEKVIDALGGSASYFSVAARFFTPVSIVAVVGEDFKEQDHAMLAARGIDLRASSGSRARRCDGMDATMRT